MAAKPCVPGCVMPCACRRDSVWCSARPWRRSCRPPSPGARWWRAPHSVNCLVAAPPSVACYRPWPANGRRTAMPERHIRALTAADLPAVLAMERLAHAVPWTQGNFADALASGYYMVVMDEDGELLG